MRSPGPSPPPASRNCGWTACRSRPRPGWHWHIRTHWHRAVLERVVELSGGNPLALLELHCPCHKAQPSWHTLVEISRCGLNSARHSQLAESRPVVLRNRHVDDPGRLGKVRWQRFLRLPEVLGLDMGGPGRIVAKGLDQDILRTVLEAARPVEPQAARLAAGGPGELIDDLSPPVGMLREYSELGGDENHLILSSAGWWRYAPQRPSTMLCDRRSANRASVTGSFTRLAGRPGRCRLRTSIGRARPRRTPARSWWPVAHGQLWRRRRAERGRHLLVDPGVGAAPDAVGLVAGVVAGVVEPA